MRLAKPASLLVFDLDGTILRVNSFPRWAMCLMVGRLPGLGLRRRVRLSLHALLLVVMRKLGGLSHVELQRRLQAAVAPCQPATTARFRASLLQYVRPNLLALLEMVRHQRIDAVLATAASREYAEELGRQLGFGYIVATQSSRNTGQSDNSGEEKRRQVHRIRAEQGWTDRSIILFTDHIDDLPLILDSSLVCWFGSSDMLLKVRALAEDVRFIDGRDLSHAELSAILRIADDVACHPPMSAMTVS